MSQDLLQQFRRFPRQYLDGIFGPMRLLNRCLPLLIATGLIATGLAPAASAFAGAAAPASVGNDPPPHTVRATGIIRAVRSQTVLVPRIEGLGGNLTLATLAG